ncbi:murein biosynthesis integral membrane protein MurJ [Candidatus Roizmanbacteria bacterium]|nr:murein biosynthesis integral membrane protein MurJ [Candidatus Roizmanbacteria bacterium]
MIKRLFSRQQTSILSAAFIIASMVAASRVLGLIRNRLLTARFTASELDPYFASFRIPDFLFELLVAGSVSVAFIPVFTHYLSKNKKEDAYKIASSVINIAVLIFSCVSLLLFIFTPVTVRIIAPGFSPDQHAQMVVFTRIMVLFQVFPLVVGNFLSGILQSFRYFIVPALAPVAYNIGIIIGIIFLTPLFGMQGAIYGVVIGAFLFLCIQLLFMRGIGYRHSYTIDHTHPGVREIGKLMIPRTMGIAFSQIDATVDVMLASLIGTGSVTIFALAQQLQLVPIGLFALPIAQASLPTFSEYVSREHMEQFKKSLLTSLHQILFLVCPASAFLAVLRIPVVRLVYGADRFDWPSTVLTGTTLAIFAVSLSAQGAIHLLARAFFALHDSKTPVRVGIASVALNSILSIVFILIWKLPVWALAVSTSTALCIHAVILLIICHRRVGGFDRVKLIVPFIKIAAATAIMAVFLYVPMKLLDQLVFDTTRTLSLLLLTGTASCIGLATYLFFSWFFNIEEVGVFINFGRKLIHVKDILFEPSREVIEEKS